MTLQIIRQAKSDAMAVKVHLDLRRIQFGIFLPSEMHLPTSGALHGPPKTILSRSIQKFAFMLVVAARVPSRSISISPSIPDHVLHMPTYTQDIACLFAYPRSHLLQERVPIRATFVGEMARMSQLPRLPCYSSCGSMRIRRRTERGA